MTKIIQSILSQFKKHYDVTTYVASVALELEKLVLDLIRFAMPTVAILFRTCELSMHALSSMPYESFEFNL